MTTRFFLSSLTANVDQRLTYGHKLPNRFATADEAVKVARDLLRTDCAVWSQRGAGSPRKVVASTAAA